MGTEMGSMSGWLRHDRQPRLPAELARCLDEFAPPLALMMAVSEVSAEYARNVQAGKVKTPAYARRDADALSMWQDMRTEALLNLYRFGTPDFRALTDPARQLEVLDCFLDEQPHLQSPWPRGDQPADTLHALYHVYLYLEEAAESVCAGRPYHWKPDAGGMALLCDFNRRAQELRDEYRAFCGGLESDPVDPHEMPRTIFEILYDEVTIEAKRIALSANFGPRYESVMSNSDAFTDEEMHEQVQDDRTLATEWTRTRRFIESILSADDPDHLVMALGRRSDRLGA